MSAGHSSSLIAPPTALEIEMRPFEGVCLKRQKEKDCQSSRRGEAPSADGPSKTYSNPDTYFCLMFRRLYVATGCRFRLSFRLRIFFVGRVH